MGTGQTPTVGDLHQESWSAHDHRVNYQKCYGETQDRMNQARTERRSRLGRMPAEFPRPLWLKKEGCRMPWDLQLLHHARDRSHFSPPAGSRWPQQLSAEGQARAIPWECSGFSFTLTSEVASPWLPNLSKGRFLEKESGNDGWS